MAWEQIHWHHQQHVIEPPQKRDVRGEGSLGEDWGEEQARDRKGKIMMDAVAPNDNLSSYLGPAFHFPWTYVY